jgi:circadian clock protein KaiB
VTRICEQDLAGQYELEIVDIYRQPERARTEEIVAVPTLIQTSPGTTRRIVGDLAETDLVRSRLGI